MPCTSTVPKCFGPDQKFSAVPKKICAGAKTKFTEWKSSFGLAQKFFEKALNAVKFLGWLKKFGPAQNILGPVKGQGNREVEL